MSVATIYRIQDLEGRGPYRPGFSHHWTDVLHNFRNPTFMDEFPRLVFKPNYGAFGSGFRNLEQLRSWFSELERAKLEQLGYHIVTMHADRILAESPRQLVFWRARPLAIDAEPLAWAIA